MGISFSQTLSAPPTSHTITVQARKTTTDRKGRPECRSLAGDPSYRNRVSETRGAVSAVPEQYPISQKDTEISTAETRAPAPALGTLPAAERHRHRVSRRLKASPGVTGLSDPLPTACHYLGPASRATRRRPVQPGPSLGNSRQPRGPGRPVAH